MFRLTFGLFRLDYISCLLTVASTLLVGRKQWTGLVLAGVNSAIVCVIGVKTAEYGFIPANVFCIVTYAVSVRSWRHDRKIANDTTSETSALEPQEPRMMAESSPRTGGAAIYERWKRQAAEGLMRARSIATISAQN